MTAKLLLIHALSPLHCGTGQAVGGIDLPIAREKPTGIPLLPGSSLKGVLRARGTHDESRALHLAVFGPDTENAADHAGSVQFSDCTLAFLPVRSVRGTFAWVCSPYMLRRLTRDAEAAGVELPPAPGSPNEDHALVTGPTLVANDRVVFEDFDFRRQETDAWKTLATRVARMLFQDKDDKKFFVERACLVHDDVMSLLLDSCTEITARTKLQEDTKTVQPGALWTEEALPVESILAGLMVATPVKVKGETAPRAADDLFAHVEALVPGGAVQVGGKATVGRGLCRLVMGG